MSIEHYPWGEYASDFNFIITGYQETVYRAAAAHVYGEIIDCGSGPAKVTPYLSSAVTTYTGVDSSADMIQLGQHRLNAQGHPQYQLMCQPIEQAEGQYDCAISLQSLYACENPAEVLRHTSTLLKPGGRLVLATANDQLDIEKLLENAAKPWLGFPGWDSFADHNRRLANSTTAHFFSMDELIGLLRSARFKIHEAHQQFFDGGLNFVLASSK